ncbi:asparagine synthetase B family protein [Sphingomonas canadensis]|uniref:asparagine synthase (glutamine-hydrolyzing) n=1 Tax=Sphingomonas canadensis TaxID=1219257 RepID=A0ABW3HC07_9SPHN|nr:asparagine synthetase B [Sphingomonas canadensis]MCW3838434.1 asparagine synthase-related protein [Sphingomonas canadensis]
MTVLAGRWNFDGRPGAAADCARMLAAQRRFAPDGDACADLGVAAIGRGLFATLPEDGYDRGPVSGGDGRFALVSDIRLDDREALAGAIGIAADQARTLTDAMLLMRAWERWQEEVFDRLSGDYAFALWDARERRMLLARDGIGTKPLHYHVGPDFLAFASMPGGLHALAEVPYAPDEVRTAEFLALLPERGPRSFFAGISRVEPGHWVAIAPGSVATHRHWEPRPERLRIGADEACEGLREHFGRAVAARLRGAGGGVAAHLSAGMDSSAVAATAARLLAPGSRLFAFTAVPGEPPPAAPGRITDEGPLAAATAAMHPNITHLLVKTDARPVSEDWDRDYPLLQRPVLNPFNQRWWNAINDEIARRGLRILLTGEMGNISISYDGIELLPELLRQGALLRLARAGRGLVHAGRMRWGGVAATALGPWIPRPAWRLLTRLRGGAARDPAVYSVLARGSMAEMLRSERELELRFRPHADAVSARLWHLRRFDPGNHHMAAAGGWGIDVRDPTADRRLIEFCLSLPPALFLEDGRPRALARRAFADRLAPEVAGGTMHGVQAADWYRGMDAARDALKEEAARLHEVPSAWRSLDLDQIETMVDAWPEGAWQRPEVIARYRFALARGAACGHFLRRASRSNA